MRIMDLLPAYEIKRFNRPPAFNNNDRKKYFTVDEPIREAINQAKQIHSKIGLLLQYGYFKSSGKFFVNKSFKSSDIRFVSKLFGVTELTDFLGKYTDRMCQRHRLLILDACGHIEFSNAIAFFDEAVSDMVNKQMHPRKMFYLLVEQLRQKKIELPSYDRMSKTITEKFHDFEKNLTKMIAEVITSSQKEALEQLIEHPEKHYERSLLNRLKTINQSLKPRRIKIGIRNFLIIKKIRKELTQLIDTLALSTEATKYYAQWVIKSKTTQLSEITEPCKSYLYLIAFIDHCYKSWQDTLVDIMLKSVQQQLNKAQRAAVQTIIDSIPEKNQLTVSLLSKFDDSQNTIHAVQAIVYNEKLNSDDKILELCKIIPSPSNSELLSQFELDQRKLKDQLNAEISKDNEFDILNHLSRKLQNRVADILKYLEFETSKSAEDLHSAVLHYQTVKNITSKAPSAFLSDLEYNAVYRDETFNVSLYKAILFCKVASGIKCGQISLVHSYRYLSIDAYLIPEHYWEERKTQLLEKFGLTKLLDVEKVLSQLRCILDKQFIDVNQRIFQGKNEHITIQKENSFSVHTPAVEKLDYSTIAMIIGQDRYISILQMMSEMNVLTSFTSNFKHHKIKNLASGPEDQIFYAGIFGLASNIGLHKLANTAIGINYNTLSNTVNWYFSLENLYAVNHSLTDLMSKLWLPEKFKRENALLHTSSDGKKQCVSAESLNANESFKYFGNGKGSSVYRFIDERGILFYSTVFSSSERDAAYVIDGLLHNDAIASDIHSTDTHGYTEMIFAVSHLIGVTFAPRIKDPSGQNLVSFTKLKSELTNKGYPIKPAYYVNEHKIKKNWDNILRLIVTIKLREHRASTLLKRMGEYSNQHPLQEALKEFGRIIKSIFMLKYFDDVNLRQTIEKQLNKGELANKFSGQISFANQNLLEAEREDQEISIMCRTIIQNIIILWNYVELTKIMMKSTPDEREVLLKNILSASIITWQHVNLHGTYDFSNLLSANDPSYSLDDMIKFRTA